MERTGSIRRALFWTTSERYVGLLLNFVLVVVVSRLLAPAEIGIMQLGSIVMILSEPLRDFGVGAYLVQKSELDSNDARTAFTVALVFSAFLAVVVFASAGPFASFYGEPGLRAFMRVLAPTFVLAPFSAIPLAFLRREMAFGSLAFINVSCITLNITAIIVLVALGYSYMSPAWAAWMWSAGFIVLALWMRPELSYLRPSLRGWRSVFLFGGYSAVPQTLQRLHDFLPSMVVGRLLSMRALGFFDRAARLSDLPEKIGTIGVQAVALPGFASAARAGGSLKQSYLQAIEHVTVVQWPGLLLLILLAEPVVFVVLGPQWNSVIMLVRIIAVAFLASFSRILSEAVLIAAGHPRDTLMVALLTLPVTLLLFVAASLHGLSMAAVSLIAIGLLRAVVSNVFVCRRLAIGWREIIRSLQRSVVVSTIAMMGPLVIAAVNGLDLSFGIAVAVLVGVAALPGWLFGLWITGHPFGAEITRALQRLQADPRTIRFLAPFLSSRQRNGGGDHGGSGNTDSR